MILEDIFNVLSYIKEHNKSNLCSNEIKIKGYSNEDIYQIVKLLKAHNFIRCIETSDEYEFYFIINEITKAGLIFLSNEDVI